MKQLTIEHLLPHLKKGAKAILSNQGKYNLDEEYPNPLNNQIGAIKSLCIDFETGEYSGVLRITDRHSVDFENGDIILCLLPLNCLTKEIEHIGEKFVPIERLLEYVHSDFKESLRSDIANWRLKWDTLPYWVIQRLFEWHFDVFGLINDNLAIDLNKI